MPVTATTARNVSTAASNTTVFPYGFKIVVATDLRVTVNGALKVLNVDYTLTGVGLDGGGNVTFTAPMVGGEIVLRQRAMAYARAFDYQVLGDFRAGTVNNDFDSTVLMVQQLADSIGLAIKLPADSSASAQLPAPAALAPLVWKADLSGIDNGSTALTGDMLLRPNLAVGSSTTGTALVSHLRPLTSAVNQTLYSRFNAMPLTSGEFGCAGDATTDDTVKVQAMFDAAAGITANAAYVQGALVQLPPGSFYINDTITFTRPPMVIGSGYSERSNNAIGAGRGITQFVAGPGLAGKPMFKFKSDTANEWLFGGKFLNITLLGQNQCAYGIWMSSCSRTEIDVAAFRFTIAGVRNDDSNGVLSDRNLFTVFYNCGANTASLGSHGLWIIGSNSGAPSTGNPQNIIRRLHGLFNNGDGLRLEGDVDNTVIQHTAMAGSGGTGRNVAIVAGVGGVVPRNNFFQYTAGGAHYLDSTTFGNRFRTTSESTSFTGGGQYDLEIADYATGGTWQTRRYHLSDEINFSPQEFLQSASAAGAVQTSVASYVAGWSLSAGTNNTIALTRPLPVTWHRGSIKRVRIYYTFEAAPGAGTSVVLKTALQTSSLSAPIVGVPVVDQRTVALPSNSIRQNFYTDVTLAAPVAFTKGDLLMLSIGRVVGGADTATTACYIMGATVYMESTGPGTPGSGTLTPSIMGN